MQSILHATHGIRARSIFPRYLFCTRSACSAVKTIIDDKSFSKTLLLPKTTFPLWSDASKNEIPFRLKTCDRLYRWQWENADGPLFVLLDGPPYANGDLHIGHALNKILKDIINRHHVSLGHRVHYFPGWDCHGLPIENKALQELRKDSLALPPNTIRAAASATATREVASQQAQFRQFGIMADWTQDSTFRTSDPKYEIRQLRIFQKMVENGFIYRHYRPVHYSPSSHSALAEAELIYRDDHISHSVYLCFAIDLQAEKLSSVLREILSPEIHANLLVWTTTPWTLTANMAIAVHPELSYVVLRQKGSKIIIVAKNRLQALIDIIGPSDQIADILGSDLVGASYKPLFSPLSGNCETFRIIPASHVTSDSGTGLVHCAPAHGAEDYNAFRALGLISSSTDMLCHVDGAGKFTEKVLDVTGEVSGKPLIGQEVLTSGSRSITQMLKEIGALVKVERIKHRYPYDWKTNEPIIVMATSQWFANLGNIKDDALNALNDVCFFPPSSRNRLESFVRSRSEWCISRQRVWGVPIPALHHTRTDRTVLDSASLDHIISVLEEKGVAYWWDGPVEDFVPASLREDGVSVGESWRKGTDTMDVWFDSGTSWSMLADMGVGRDGDQRSFDADVCLEGSDQHRGWFQSQLLTAVGSASGGSKAASPYRTLITHGMVLDEDGKKMSKSLGNVVSPMSIINGGKNKKTEPAYGADILRLWVATVEYWRDVSIGPTSLAQSAESMRKIRNSARFILGNIGDAQSRRELTRVKRKDLGLAERYVMHQLYKLENVALEGYASYNFPKVINALTNFANITLSSLFFDITKDSLYANGKNSLERRAVVTVLEQILTSMTSVLAPVLPHLAEEIFFTIRGGENKADGPSFFMTKWTPLGTEWYDQQAEQDMNTLLRIRSVVYSLLEKARAQKHVRSSLEAEVDIVISSDIGADLLAMLHREEPFLKTLFIVSDACLTDEGFLGAASPEWLYSDSVSLPGTEDDLGIRLRPATLSKCPRCWTFTRLEHDTLCQRCDSVLNKT